MGIAGASLGILALSCVQPSPQAITQARPDLAGGIPDGPNTMEGERK